MRLRALFAILSLCPIGMAVPTYSAQPRSTPIPCPADAELSRLIAASEVVLIGKMAVPRERLAEEAAKPSPAYLNIPITVESVVKGTTDGQSAIRFYPQDRSYAPTTAAVLDMADEPAILFLVTGDGWSPGLYFAGYSQKALAPATDRAVEAVRAEVARQVTIIGSSRKNPSLPHYREVRRLIAKLGVVEDEEQQRVFDRLERLGRKAVPAIVAQMDDRRPLKTRAITLVNHATDRFERTRHYGPVEVVDGLDAELGQITGQHFGSITNGGSPQQRDSTVAGWRVYVSNLRCGAP